MSLDRSREERDSNAEERALWVLRKNLVLAPKRLPGSSLPAGWKARASASRPKYFVLEHDGLKLYATREGNNFSLLWATVSEHQSKPPA